MYTVLLVILILVLIGALPATGWHNLGYMPSGAAGVILLVLIILLLMGRL